MKAAVEAAEAPFCFSTNISGVRSMTRFLSRVLRAFPQWFEKCLIFNFPKLIFFLNTYLNFPAKHDTIVNSNVDFCVIIEIFSNFQMFEFSQIAKINQINLNFWREN